MPLIGTRVEGYPSSVKSSRMNRNNAVVDSARPLNIFLVVLLLAAIVIRLLGFRYRLNADLVHFVIPWTRLIDEQGLTGLYEGISRQTDWAVGLLAEGGEGVAGIHNADRPVDVTYNYTPFYSYLLSLFGILPFGEAVRAKIISVVFDAIDEPWKVEDRGEKPAIALKGR
jgi:hypothetical protein